MINLILHTMKKEEQMFRMFSLLHNIAKGIKENGHHFDANSEECKGCECFVICKEFHAMMTAINDSDFDEKIKNDMGAFIVFMKHEYLFVDSLDIEDVLKDDDSLLSGYYKRFETVIADFKNYDKLVQILDDNQLSIIRKIILDVTAKIEELMNKIMDRNRAESVILIGRLQKPQQEKSYEDMTKEELIAILNNK